MLFCLIHSSECCSSRQSIVFVLVITVKCYFASFIIVKYCCASLKKPDTCYCASVIAIPYCCASLITVSIVFHSFAVTCCRVSLIKSVIRSSVKVTVNLSVVNSPLNFHYRCYNNRLDIECQAICRN